MSATVTETEAAGTIKLVAAYDEKKHEDASSPPHQTLSPPMGLTSTQYKYHDYLPVYDEKTTFPALEPFEFTDRGLAADKAKPNLLSPNIPGLQVTKLTPSIGTEIRGLQLSELDDAQKNELALLIAERGVVIFRGQDFKDIGIERQKAFAGYFGPLHIHASGDPPSVISRVRL